MWWYDKPRLQGDLVPTFDFKALDSGGAIQRGRIVAIDLADAYEKITAMGGQPFEVSRQYSMPRISGIGSASGKQLFILVRQLAVLLASGVSLADCIDSLANSNTHERLGESLQSVKTALRSGVAFSVALKEHFPTLPEYVFHLAELGEATGNLGGTLTEAADQFEADRQLQSEIRQALAYPMFLLGAGFLIVSGMFVFVVPRFAEMIEKSGADVPPLSRMVVSMSLFYKEHLILCLLALAGTVGALVFASRRRLLRFDVLTGRLPLIGRLKLVSSIARWARTLSGALRHGADLLPALELAEKTVPVQSSMREELMRARRQVRAGKPLADALATNLNRADPFVIDMVRTGEASGRLHEMLLFVSDMFRKETTERTKQVTSLIEPLAIVSISCIVGTIVISIVLAMTSVYQFGS